MSRLHRALAGAAAALGILAALAGGPRRGREAALDVAALAREVAREEDHVTALELAAWIRDRRPDLRVVDLRRAEELDHGHLPGAEPVALEDIGGAPFDADDTIVLASQGGTHAAQAWVLLRARGYRKVFALRGGVEAWFDDVLHPRLTPDASASEIEAFASTGALSRYFGGHPRIDLPQVKRGGGADRGTKAAPVPSSVAPARRGGC